MAGSSTAMLKRYAHVDDYLGPGNRRFFGEGYKRADHRLRGIRTETDGSGARLVAATATVSYPLDWSRKGDTDQRPHLSTIDVLLLGVQLAEVQLAGQLGLDPEQRAGMWVRRARIKAGSSPVEEDLAGFPVTAGFAGSVASPGFPERQISTVHCTVGSLKVTLDLDHARPSGGAVADPLDLGDSRSRPFGEGYKDRGQRVTDVTVDPEGLRSTAVVRLTAADGASGPGVGVEGRYQPSVGLIDTFVVALQLGQVLLYELDQLSRADSDTLWMRSTLFEADSPHRPAEGDLTASAALENSMLLHKGDETWRRAEIVAALEGVRMTCSVVHRLP